MKRRDFLKAAGSTAVVAGAAATGAAEARPNLEPPPKAVAMLYDSTLCVGCKACVDKCKQVNAMPPDFTTQDALWDAARDIGEKTLNVIKVYKHGTAEVKDRAENGYAFVKDHCKHCVDAGCVSVCPVSAMRKHPETGVVTHHPENCIGCRYCVYACPYNVPKYELGKRYGQIRKCQFCNQKGVERLDKGMLPGCVEVCPTGASLYGTREEILAEAKRRLALKPGQPYAYPRGHVNDRAHTHEKPAPRYEQHIFGEKEGGGTQVLYIAGVPYQKLGLPELPERSYASRSEGVQHTLYNKGILPGAILAGLVYAAHRASKRHDDES
ncbi:MAG: hydrogenase 2 operon protein HybA [Gammaproteobacteria bacterium]